MTNEHDESSLKRWTAKRRAALVVDVLRGTTTVVEAARKHGLTVAEIEQWKERFLGGAENALESRSAGLACSEQTHNETDWTNGWATVTF